MPSILITSEDIHTLSKNHYYADDKNQIKKMNCFEVLVRRIFSCLGILENVEVYCQNSLRLESKLRITNAVKKSMTPHLQKIATKIQELAIASSPKPILKANPKIPEPSKDAAKLHVVKKPPKMANKNAAIDPVLPDSFPITITNGITRVYFKSHEEASKLIELIAERIASIFSKYLTPDYHKAREGHLVFSISCPEIYPNANLIEKFKTKIKEIIISGLSTDKEMIIFQRVHSISQDVLQEIGAAADVYTNAHKFFPEVRVSVSLMSNKLIVWL